MMIPETPIGQPILGVEDLPALLQSVPPQTLHAYTLSHLPNAPPHIASSLAIFYALLTPPPVLHCVRCHSSFTDVENSDRACRIAHDDESAEVERVGVGGARKRRAGGVISEGATYETNWGCCGKTVEGDGGEGPPDGWCYEGAHTVSHNVLVMLYGIWLSMMDAVDGSKTSKIQSRLNTTG
jgi:hypothetical protein